MINAARDARETSGAASSKRTHIRQGACADHAARTGAPLAMQRQGQRSIWARMVPSSKSSQSRSHPPSTLRTCLTRCRGRDIASNQSLQGRRWNARSTSITCTHHRSAATTVRRDPHLALTGSPSRRSRHLRRRPSPPWKALRLPAPTFIAEGQHTRFSRHRGPLPNHNGVSLSVKATLSKSDKQNLSPCTVGSQTFSRPFASSWLLRGTRCRAWQTWKQRYSAAVSTCGCVCVCGYQSC